MCFASVLTVALRLPGVTELEHMPHKPHFHKSDLVHEKHPYFHGEKKFRAKLAKKKMMTEHEKPKVAFDF